MGLFEQFPYTNFHELNLDFILRKLKKLEDRMAELDGKMAALEGKMDVLQDEMYQLREAMAALVQLVESFRGTLDSHTQELEALNARCDSLESGLTALEVDVAALTGRVDSAESGINALAGRVAVAEVDITALKGRMDSVERNISALRENIETLAADVAADIVNINDNMEILTARVQNLENAVAEIEGEEYLIDFNVFGDVVADELNGYGTLAASTEHVIRKNKVKYDRIDFNGNVYETDVSLTINRNTIISTEAARNPLWTVIYLPLNPGYKLLDLENYNNYKVRFRCGDYISAPIEGQPDNVLFINNNAIGNVIPDYENNRLRLTLYAPFGTYGPGSYELKYSYRIDIEGLIFTKTEV